MSKRYYLPKSVGGYAIKQPGETGLDAIKRALAKRLGGVSCTASSNSYNIDRADNVISYNYQLTVLGRRNPRSSGSPILGEYHIIVNAEDVKP